MEDTCFLGQDWLRLEDENLFINPKCYFLFDFMPEVSIHDCVVHENVKTYESQKFNAKRVISLFNSLPQNPNFK